MKLQNNTKTAFMTSKGRFEINAIIDFEQEEANTLVRYEGINKISDLEVSGSKEEAPALSLKSKKKAKSE